jgi:hypothetical protein
MTSSGSISISEPSVDNMLTEIVFLRRLAVDIGQALQQRLGSHEIDVDLVRLREAIDTWH